MSADFTAPTTDLAPGKYRVSHSGWLLTAIVLSVVAYVGIRFGIPSYRQHQTIAALTARRVKLATLGDLKNAHFCLAVESADGNWLAEWSRKKWHQVFVSCIIAFDSRRELGDEDLTLFAGLKDLEMLMLGGPQITDAGVAELATLTKLTTLDLSGTQVTDAGLAHLAGLTNLETLILSESRVTDRGLPLLARFKQLETLWLDETQITNEGVRHLAGFTELRYLGLDGSRVTADGVAKIKAALPNCEISGP